MSDSEWLDVMLEEIERKREEEADAAAEAERRQSAEPASDRDQSK